MAIFESFARTICREKLEKMRTKLLTTSIIVMLTVFLAPASAVAVHPWFAAKLSVDRYSMTDVNARLDEPYDAYPGKFARIKDDNGWELNIGIRISDLVSICGSCGELSAESEVGGEWGSYSENYDARLIRVFLIRHFPTDDGIEFGLGGGIGRVSSKGKIVTAETGVVPRTADIVGSDFVFDTFLTGECRIHSRLAVLGIFGYRRANIREVEFVDSHSTIPVYNGDDTRFSIDYSGLYFQIGMKVTFK